MCGYSKTRWQPIHFRNIPIELYFPRICPSLFTLSICCSEFGNNLLSPLTNTLVVFKDKYRQCTFNMSEHKMAFAIQLFLVHRFCALELFDVGRLSHSGVLIAVQTAVRCFDNTSLALMRHVCCSSKTAGVARRCFSANSTKQR